MSQGSLKQLADLRGSFGPYRRALVFGLLAIAASVGVGLFAPLVVGHAVDRFREDVSAATLAFYSGGLLLITLVRGIFSFTQRSLIVKVSRDIELDLRNEYFAHLERMHQGYFQESAIGDLMARATKDLQAVRMLCGPAIMYSVTTVLAALGSLIFMVRIHPRLTLAAMVTMPLVALATQVFGSRIHDLFEEVQGRFAALTAKVQENLSGLRVVRAYARERWEEAQFEALDQAYVEQNRKLIRWTAVFHPLLQVLVGCGFASVLWYGGRLMIAGELTIGEFVAFHFFLARLVWPMIAVGWVVNLVQRGTASLARIREVLDTSPSIQDRLPLIQLRAFRGEIELRRLSFAYRPHGPWALRDVDLQVPAGSTLGIVGRVAAGKSTLLQLIPRLLEVPEGVLFVDLEDVNRYPLAALREAVAMVPQESFLFSTTIRDNVLMGRPGSTDQEVREAVTLAGLEADLALFPSGLDTLVGERGITLSGGQKQRVALARALLRRAPILLLDDCLSAVDAETEQQILQGLRQGADGRTVLMASHRTSAVEAADQILVLEGGRRAELGTHLELLQNQGIYWRFYQRQQMEDELAAI